MLDRDEMAALLAAVSWDPADPGPAAPRDVTLAAAKYGWFPDPPWFPASQPVKQ